MVEKMAEKEVILTLEGLRRLEQELEHLKCVKRREVAERIKQAREFGDITDNSEYEDAKKEQAFIEGRILELERMLRSARLIEDVVDTRRVRIGSRVKLRDLEFGGVLEYMIVGSAEADPGDRKISNESPVGKALLGCSVGSVVEVSVPAGVMRYEILEINR